jgi:hypothetical protein
MRRWIILCAIVLSALFMAWSGPSTSHELSKIQVDTGKCVSGRT